MRRLLALALALLCLASCASMLERDYTVTADHVENPPPQMDAAYRVETYPALTSALLSYAEEGLETGVLHFPTTYAGNLTVDLEKARRHLLEEEPLGCYALEDMSFHTSKIVAYYEAELTFTYKVDKAELTSLSRAAGRDDLAKKLGETLKNREARLAVYLTNYPEEEEGFLDDLLLQLWTEREETDPLPLLSATFYPETGKRRVAVLELSYPEPEPKETGTVEGETGQGEEAVA